MSASQEVKEFLEIQLGELETLQSVYPDELRIVDHGIVADINEFMNGNRQDLPQRLQYSITVSVPEGSAELQINLPPRYPETCPDIYVSTQLDRMQQKSLNEDLTTFVLGQELGEPYIHLLISWLQDNLENYFKEFKKKEVKTKNRNNMKNGAEERSTVFARYWVYSHHIYSNTKRKSILDEARENDLTGFCLCGKPGIICIEGALNDCEYWWKKIKVMNWHKILIKFMEEENCEQDYNSLRKFTDFQEISFPSLDKHNDMSQLLKYLSDHNLQHVFKELFGVEGKAALLA